MHRHVEQNVPKGFEHHPIGMHWHVEQDVPATINHYPIHNYVKKKQLNFLSRALSENTYPYIDRFLINASQIDVTLFSFASVK